MADRINGDYKNKDILSIDQFDAESISLLFKKTGHLIELMKRDKSLELLQGRVITLLFFEPSSRTFGSFSSAVKHLGGNTIDIQDPVNTTSWVKGETLEDTIKVYETYSDAIIIRHPEIGSARRAARAAAIPIINGGDGAGEHPTQTLYDLYTIFQKFDTLDGLTVVLTGDPLHSRTIKSLLKGLAKFKNNTAYILSPKELKIPVDFRKELTVNGLKIVEINQETDIPENADVWYWNRIQKERFSDVENYKKNVGNFILTNKLLEKKGNKKLILLDPLPRVEEIAKDVDGDPRALYLTTQLKNGLYIRMALVALVLGTL